MCVCMGTEGNYLKTCDKSKSAKTQFNRTE